MLRNLVGWLLLSSITAVGARAQAQRAAAAPSSAEIRKILADRIDKQQRGVGIVVGVIEPTGRRVVAYGAFGKDDERPLNGDTIFEIGSITKVFTALLLADMVERGEVAFDDPVSEYLPAEVKLPERGGQSITLEHLANHTSGLPRLPENLFSEDPTNPYTDYSVDQMYEFLSGYELMRDIGAEYEYSNLGAGLLGHVLARRAGTNYESLVKARVCEPLGMRSTGITLSAEMKALLAAGHDSALEPVANWDLPTLAGAGALRSSVNDMLPFLAAHLGYAKTPLASAIASLLSPRGQTGKPNLEIARAWHIETTHGAGIVLHDGGTGGYSSLVCFSPKSRVGVVVLSNASVSVNDIAMHLIDRRYELSEPPRQREEISINPKLFEGYLGRYELTPEFILTVTLEDDRLFVQATGQPKAEVFPESETKYFYKVVDAQITFDTDAEGRATGLTLHQNGRNLPAKRIEGSASPQPQPAAKYEEVEVAPALFTGYVGRFQLTPSFTLSITKEDGRLFAQATGQPKFEIFPLSEKEYFLKVVDARITFETDATGRATALTLHQNGRDLSAKRIE